MGKNKNSQLYATTLTYIKYAINAASESHEDAFPQLKALLQTIEDEKINIDEMCRFGGAYHHNKYIMGVFYLTLAECYDPDICPNNADVRIAQRYYMMSEQPPAKWRLGRIYLSEKVYCNGNPELVASKLICEAIYMLINDDDYNQKYFEKRLAYLVDMYQDLYEMKENKKIHYDVYFDILKWIISNRNNVRDEHQDIIYKFMEWDVPSQSKSDEMTLEEFTTKLG